MKELEKLDKEVEGLETKRQDLFAKVEPLNAALVSNYKKLERLKNKRDKLKLASLKKKGKDFVDLDIMLCGDPESTIMYKERERQLKKLSLNSSGYIQETGQVCIQISLNKSDDKLRKKVFSSICFLLPHLIPVKRDSRSKKEIVLDIFEHTLSQYGSYYLHLSEADPLAKCKIVRSYGVEEDFKNLDEALKYIQKHHWYEE